MYLRPVEVTIEGAEKLSRQLDKIEDLVWRLRMELADLEQSRLKLEMRFNPADKEDDI